MAARQDSTGWQRLLVFWGSIVLVVASLYWARAVLLPVVVALLLTFILSPVVSALQRRGVPRVPASILAVLAASLVVAGLLFAVYHQLTSLAVALQENKEGIANKIRTFQSATEGSWLGSISDTVRDIFQRVQNRGGTRGPEATAVPVRPVDPGPYIDFGFVTAAISPAFEALLSIGLAIVLVLFMLIQREDLRNRLIRLWGQGSLTNMTKALDDAAHRISRYLLVQLAVNAAFGLITAIGMFFIGVPYAFLWGFLAGVLRFIPYIGIWVAALMPIALTFILPDSGWTAPILVAVLFLSVDLVTSNLIEPSVYGQSIGVSEVALLISVAFWAWLWGAFGFILATPLTACLVVLGRYVPQLEFFAVLLGDEPVLAPSVAYYQRLIAHDQDEAFDLVEDFLDTHPPEEVYDQVLTPALVLTKQARNRDELSEEDTQFIYDSTRELLDEQVGQRQQAAHDLAAEEAEGRETTSAVLVFGYPAQDEADELAHVMFQHMLDPTKCKFEVISSHALSAEVIARVHDERPAAVCIALLPPTGLTRVRYLCKRFRTQSPATKIIVGCWGASEERDRIQRRLRDAGADAVGFSLAQSRDQLLPYLQVSAAGGAEAHELARTGAAG